LAGLVIDLRGFGGEPEVSDELKLSLQKRLRVVAENLLKVDRIITQQMRDSVVRFQLSVIGILGIILSCSSFFLIMLFRRSVRPLLQLSEALRPDAGQLEQLPYPPDSGNEIVDLIEKLNDKIQVHQLSEDGQELVESEKKIDTKLAVTINEALNSLNGILNYTQLLLESDSISGDDRRMLEQIRATVQSSADKWQKQSHGF
ncbi:MAG: hypothetical protein D6B25_12445, partial [Desulfobulbaceae bacterium]